MDWRCRESEGKAKIEGYMSVSDEEAHQRELESEVVKKVAQPAWLSGVELWSSAFSMGRHQGN